MGSFSPRDLSMSVGILRRESVSGIDECSVRFRWFIRVKQLVSFANGKGVL